MVRSRAATIGIDIGTTATKAMVVAEDGGVLAESEVEQEISTPHPAWAEQDPEMWWASTKLAVADAMRHIKGMGQPVEVRGIGLSGQMHSSVFLDRSGKVIRPAILWSDGRTTPQCRDIIERMGLTGLHRTVGNLAVEGFTAPKILWLRENEPEHYQRLTTLLLPKDYVRYRMTGELATEPSDAITTLLFDVRKRQWSQEMLDALDVPVGVLPRVVESTEVSGHITAAVAAELGLPSAVPVVGGGGDNAAAAVGSGVVKVGRVQSSIGTSGTLLTPIARPRVDRHMRLHTFCSCLRDQWYLMGVILSAGNSLRWLRNVLLPQDVQHPYDLLTAEAEKVRPGSEGLFFLPYLSGERTPHNDSTARGVFFGLHLGHTRAHLVRAVMEGVCFALRDSLELMRGLGASLLETRAVGGGARSGLWRQIQADVYGAPVTTLSPTGGPPYGAALMAAVGVGILPSVLDAADEWLHVEHMAEPEPRNVALYDELYGMYSRLYPDLKPRFSETTALIERFSN